MRQTKIAPTAPRERRTRTADEALQSLMRLCARAEKSTGDAYRLMRLWGVPEGEWRGVVERLVAERFIDNRRYAMLYTREKSSLAGWGAKKIAHQLAAKGIEREIIAEVTAQLDGDSMVDRLMDKLQRKSRTTKAANSYELRGKLLRYALGLGYDYEQAMSAIDKIQAEE